MPGKYQFILSLLIWLAMLSAIIVFALFSAPSGDFSQIERSLQQSYQQQIRAVQNYYVDSHLKYDESGHLIGSGHPGSWTLAYVLIEKLKLTPSELEIRGVRVAARPNHNDPKDLIYVRSKEDVRIDIALPADASEAQLRSVLERVFYPMNKLSIPAMPDYWRDVMTGNLGHCPAAMSVEEPPTQEASGVHKMICGGVPIYRVTGGIKPPKALRAPDAKYTEFARLDKYQGTSVLWLVVDQNGRPIMIRIVRVLGMGLDDAGVEAVRHWQFKPAELDGHPVAVQVNVEVNFRLH